MPYIKDVDRGGLFPAARRDANTPGELNYQFTELMAIYWERHAGYQGINDILGALEGAKLEFYRRIAVPYENRKLIENGDVY